MLLVSIALACTASSTDDDEGGEADPVTCEDCTDKQACIGYLGGEEEDRFECIELPAECATPACDDNACWNALYDQCDSGWIGVGCSDPLEQFGLTYSCNPDD